MNRKQLITYLPDLIKYYKDLEKWQEQYDARVIRQKEIETAILKGEKPPRKLPKQDLYLKGEFKPEYPIVEEMEDLSKEERLSLEKKTLGVYFTGHPLDEYPHLLNEYKITISDIINGDERIEDGCIVSFPAVISKITKKCSKAKKDYAVVILEDITGRLETTIFPATWKKLELILEEEQIIIANGKVNLTEQEEGASIVNFILNKVTIPNFETISLQSLSYRLCDGSTIEFRPSDKSTLIEWSKGKTYLKGI